MTEHPNIGVPLIVDCKEDAVEFGVAYDEWLNARLAELDEEKGDDQV